MTQGALRWGGMHRDEPCIQQVGTRPELAPASSAPHPAPPFMLYMARLLAASSFPDSSKRNWNMGWLLHISTIRKWFSSMSV